jgi:hypothetical protein
MHGGLSHLPKLHVFRKRTWAAGKLNGLLITFGGNAEKAPDSIPAKA